MTELCPPLVAGHLRDALTDFLVTTFALSDNDAQAGLSAFLTDPADGIFKGPYLRTSMPFAPAPARAEHALAWMPAGFHPYTLQPVFSAKTPQEKRAQHQYFFWYKHPLAPAKKKSR